MFFQCPGVHTQSLASLLIAQEILSAAGQLQAHQRDRMAEEAHYHRHRPQSAHTNTNTHARTWNFRTATQRESPSILFVPPFLGPRTGTSRDNGRAKTHAAHKQEGWLPHAGFKAAGEEDGGRGGGGGGRWISPSLLDPTAPPGRVFGVWSSIQRVGSSRLSGSLSGCLSLTPPPSQRN